jgi:pyruvate-formate lyase-activating enzyme
MRKGALFEMSIMPHDTMTPAATPIPAEQAIEQAWSRMHAGDYATARELCDAILSGNPWHANAMYLLGAIAFENDEPASAIDWLERSLATDPSATDPYSYLEAVYSAEGRTPDVKRITERKHKVIQFTERLHTLPQRAQDYQGIVNSLRASPYIDYPREVAIETMAVCNAACTFCPYPDIERKGEKMPDSLIEKIITDLTDIPREVPFVISPFKLSDPLLDVRLFDILARCNERLPHATLRVFTNGSPLTQKHVAKLREVRNLEHLWISLNHHDPAGYEAVMKLPWKRTIERLDMLHRAKAAGEFPVPVIVSRVADGSADDAAFKAFVRTRYPQFQPGLVPAAEWLGQVQGLLAYGDGKVLPVGCGRWFELSITATGSVAFCCMDGKDEYPIGNAAETHVLEIYNNPTYRVYREHYLSRTEAGPCSMCTNL